MNPFQQSIEIIKNRTQKEYGVIYKLTSKTSKKSYIGQAAEYVSGAIPWGTMGRWKSHIRDAYNKEQNRCRVLNAAIRKYGSDDFIIKTILKCEKEYLDTFEKFYIKHEKSKVPKGYNLRSEGSDGYWHVRSKNLKKYSRIGQKHSIATKKSIGRGQIGNRRGIKKRKYKEDEALPKYISGVRSKKILIGYRVGGYPIGTNCAKYATPKIYTSQKKTLREKYNMALQHLKSLKIKYADIHKQIDDKRKNQEKNKHKDWFEDKKQKIISSLPEYVYPKFVGTKLRGYYVNSVPTHNNKLHPRRDFDKSSNHNNLKAAKRYIDSLKIENKNAIFLKNKYSLKINCS